MTKIAGRGKKSEPGECFESRCIRGVFGGAGRFSGSFFSHRLDDPGPLVKIHNPTAKAKRMSRTEIRIGREAIPGK
jgi:hypothetical protein